IAEHAAKIMSVRPIPQDPARPTADLTVARLGHRHRDDPPSNKLLGVSRIGPFGKFFGRQPCSSRRRCRGHGTLPRLRIVLIIASPSGQAKPPKTPERSTLERQALETVGKSPIRQTGGSAAT